MVTLYDHLMRMRFFTLIMNKIFIRAPKICEEGYGHDLDVLFIICGRCISYEKWVEREKCPFKAH
jgi:hypothetical protein